MTFVEGLSMDADSKRNDDDVISCSSSHRGRKKKTLKSRVLEIGSQSNHKSNLTCDILHGIYRRRSLSRCKSSTKTDASDDSDGSISSGCLSHVQSTPKSQRDTCDVNSREVYRSELERSSLHSQNDSKNVSSAVKSKGNSGKHRRETQGNVNTPLSRSKHVVSCSVESKSSKNNHLNSLESCTPSKSNASGRVEESTEEQYNLVASSELELRQNKGSVTESSVEYSGEVTPMSSRVKLKGTKPYTSQERLNLPLDATTVVGTCLGRCDDSSHDSDPEFDIVNNDRVYTNDMTIASGHNKSSKSPSRRIVGSRSLAINDDFKSKVHSQTLEISSLHHDRSSHKKKSGMIKENRKTQSKANLVSPTASVKSIPSERRKSNYVESRTTSDQRNLIEGRQMNEVQSIATKIASSEARLPESDVQPQSSKTIQNFQPQDTVEEFTKNRIEKCLPSQSPSKSPRRTTLTTRHLRRLLDPNNIGHVQSNDAVQNPDASSRTRMLAGTRRASLVQFRESERERQYLADASETHSPKRTSSRRCNDDTSYSPAATNFSSPRMMNSPNENTHVDSEATAAQEAAIAAVEAAIAAAKRAGLAVDIKLLPAQTNSNNKSPTTPRRQSTVEKTSKPSRSNGSSSSKSYCGSGKSPLKTNCRSPSGSTTSTSKTSILSSIDSKLQASRNDRSDDNAIGTVFINEEKTFKSPRSDNLLRKKKDIVMEREDIFTIFSWSETQNNCNHSSIELERQRLRETLHGSALDRAFVRFMDTFSSKRNE